MQPTLNEMTIEQLRSFILSQDTDREDKVVALEVLEEKMVRMGRMSVLDFL